MQWTRRIALFYWRDRQYVGKGLANDAVGWGQCAVCVGKRLTGDVVGYGGGGQ